MCSPLRFSRVSALDAATFWCPVLVFSNSDNPSDVSKPNPGYASHSNGATLDK
jgi:hypothetical protein